MSRSQKFKYLSEHLYSNDRPEDSKPYSTTIDEVRAVWRAYVRKGNRIGIYQYLNEVYELVRWWKGRGGGRRLARLIIKERGVYGVVDDLLNVVLYVTSDPSRVSRHLRSRWACILRYAMKYKPKGELLRDFIQRKGGMNGCARRYSRFIGGAI